MLAIRNVSPAALVILILFLSACQATPTQRSSGQYLDDEVITGKVNAALIDDATTKALQIDVETYRGMVQLNGFVDSEDARTEAARIARSVAGVREVHNNLEIRDASTSARRYIDDAALTARVKSALISSKETKAHQINVETDSAVVQLAGWVDKREAISAATQIASSVDGVKSVHNKLEIRQ